MSAIITRGKQAVLLSDSQRNQIAEILSRRANEIAGYGQDHQESIAHPERRDAMPASVHFALELEMRRLRALADAVKPNESPKPEED